MIQFIILIEFLFVTIARAREKCTCNLIQNQFQCMLLQDCQWKFNNCEKKSCSQIYYPSQCQTDEKCFYNYMNQSCQELIDCSLLNATSSDECNEQSHYCGLYNSTSKQCYSLKVQDCNFYTMKSECVYIGKGQQCLWINEKCQDFDCTLIKSQNQCHSFILQCRWEIDDQKCFQSTCNHKPISECSLILSRQKNEFILQACKIDYSEGPAKCKNASISELSPITCGLNSMNLARWSDKRLDRGSCQLCDAYIIKILVLALLIMIQ